jgi:RecJ-like exonuclease
MNKIRCKVCIGTGSILGGGMMMKDCYECDGSGKIIKEDFKEIMNKNSNEYKNAKKRIKSLDDKITDEEAEKLLDEELEKQDNDHQPKKRKKWERKTSRGTTNNLYERIS